MSVRSARYNLLSLRNPKGLTVIPEERDAWAFLDAAKITSSRQQRAVIELVRGLKHAQLWSKMKAIYPFVGGTATTHRFNLKDPRDADAAFRLSFSGGWTHSSTGALPNGINAFADTYLIISSNLALNSCHASYYGTSVTSSSYDLGAEDSTNTAIFSMYYDSATSKIYGRANRWNTAEYNFTPSPNSGYFIVNRRASTSEQVYQNTTKNNFVYTSERAPTNRIYFARINGRNNYGLRELSFATLGDGLTDTDATNLYNIVQRYQTSLGRQV